jgi:hypothetical protein
MKRIGLIILSILSVIVLAAPLPVRATPPALASTAPFVQNATPPSTTVKLIFIHHSTGEAWLADGYGNLGIALRNNNYFVSDTNYGWGQNSIGSNTDIGNWYDWFRGPNSATYMTGLYAESGQHASYSRKAADPGGANEIILFKSCFPNSALQGGINDPVPAIGSNPLRGLSAGSSYHTVANAKGIYIDLLNYFAAHQEKLFVAIAAPPLTDGTYGANARAFNNWLTDEWLVTYPYKNVAVFDYYTVLTSNGGSPSINDAGSASGNHHRLYNSAIQHLVSSSNTSAYPTGDSHPSSAGDLKATDEFLPLLNIFYHRWKDAVVYNHFVYVPMTKK